MYENPPPPSDFEYDDVEIPLFFTFPRPQRVIAPPFITVDYSLIHPSLLGEDNGKESDAISENETAEVVQEDANNNVIEVVQNEENNVIEVIQDVENNNVVEVVNENAKEVEQLNGTENAETGLITATDKDTINNEAHQMKKKVNKEKENCNKSKDKTAVLLKGDHVCSAHVKKKRIHHKRSQSKRDITFIDSDRETNNISDEVSAMEIISKPCSKESKTPVDDPYYSKLKPRKYLKSKHLKRIAVSDDDHSSYSDRPKSLNYYSRKLKECRSISSDEEQYFKYRSKYSRQNQSYKQCFKTAKVVVKQEVFSDEEEGSYFRKSESFRRERLSESDDSINRIFYERHCKRRRYKVDDRDREWYSPNKEIKQEIKHGSVDGDGFIGVDNYYCSYCKLTLNSELTWQSHLLGKRHKRAIRAQSVHEVAKSSLLATTYIPIPEEGNRHDKPPPGMERTELKNAVASIQQVCDDIRDRPIIGLRHIWEIRGEAETVYYCNLCDAPCAASSVMLHLTGYKHKLQCLKGYFPHVYERFKDAHKKKVERVIENKFINLVKLFRREKIRVFRDIPIDDYKKPFDQPGPSWQSASKGNNETMTVLDEKGNPVVPSNQEFLDTKFADFHCTVCDSHMNNVAMWEAHIRGKRHLKNLKKAPEGVAATNKYVEAPPGTVSYLERQIREVCGHDDIIVGLNYIRENQGKNGNQYNCFPCGGCCSDIDIIDHILSMKHKIKILEKMQVDGFENSIVEINNIQLSNYYREVMVDEECVKMIRKYGRGKPQVYYIKRDLIDYGAL